MYHTTAITQLFVVSQNTHTDQEAAYICWLPACQHSIHKVDFYPLFSEVVHFFLFLVTGMFKIWGKGKGRESMEPPFPWEIRLETVHVFVTMNWNYFSNQSYTTQWCLLFYNCSLLLFHCTVSLEHL